MNDKTDLKTPDLGNYNDYSPKLKELYQSSGDKETLLYIRLKAAIIAGDITVNTVYAIGYYRCDSLQDDK